MFFYFLFEAVAYLKNKTKHFYFDWTQNVC